MRRFASTTVVCAGLLIAFAGCGGGSSEPDPQARAAFIERLDRACGEWAQGVAKSSQHFEAIQVHARATDARLAAIADRYEQLAEGLDRLVADASALTPPEADSQTIDDWLAILRARADAERDIARALRSQPSDSNPLADAQTRLRADSARADSAIADYGAAQCAPRAELAPPSG